MAMERSRHQPRHSSTVIGTVMRHFLALLLIALSAPALAAPGSDQQDERFLRAVSAAWERDRTAGVSIGVVRSGALVAERHLGFADAGTLRSPDAHTIYRVASVTKAFTALMYLQLVERHVIRPTDPVTRYVPEARHIGGLPRGAAPPTLVQLATHTAGLAAEPDLPGFDRGSNQAWERQTLAAARHMRFEAGPGERYGYSNYGYALLGVALQRAARQPYDAYLRAHITEPLGMRDTGFVAADPARLAQGYAVGPGGPEPVADIGRGYKLPVGGIYTTLADLAKFVAFQMGDGPQIVLTRASLEAASRGLISVDRSMGEGYGTGFELFTNGGTVLQGHSGGMPGWRALEVFDRRGHTGYIVLRNATGGKFGDPVVALLGALPTD